MERPRGLVTGRESSGGSCGGAEPGPAILCIMLTITYDARVDAAYVYLGERGGFGFTETCEESGTFSIVIDYTAAGRIIGIEILDASYLFPSELVEKLRAVRGHREVSGPDVGITTAVRGGTFRINLGPYAQAMNRSRCNSRKPSDAVEFLWADRRLVAIVVWGYEPSPCLSG